MAKKKCPYAVVAKAIIENRRAGYPTTNAVAVNKALYKAGFR